MAGLRKGSGLRKALVGSAGGGPTALYLALSGGAQVQTGAAPGASIGGASTNAPSPTYVLEQAGGNRVSQNGATGALAVGAVRADIMRQRSIPVRMRANGITGSDQLQIIHPDAIPVVEATAPTLTVTRTGGALSAWEWGDTERQLCTINVPAGAVQPVRFAVITENSPFEVDEDSGAFLAVGWLDADVAASHTARVRVEDATGAWGVLDVVVSVTRVNGLADLQALIPDLIVLDPANASGGTESALTTLTVYSGATPHVLSKIGGGAVARNTVACPDGVSRPYLTHTGAARFKCAPSLGGTSATLADPFVRSSGAFAPWAIWSLWRTPTTQSGGTVLCQIGKDTTGSFVQKYRHQLTGARLIDSSVKDDANAATFNLTSSTIAGGLNAWNVSHVWCDGYTPYAEQNFQTYIHNINTAPSVQTRTADVNGMVVGPESGAVDWLFQVMLPRANEDWEGETINAFLTRFFPVAAPFVAPERLVRNAYTECYRTDFHLRPDGPLRIGDGWISINNNGNPNIDAINDEYGCYANELYPNIHTVFPTTNVNIVDGAAEFSLEVLTAEQLAYVQAATWSPPPQAGGAGKARYTHRSAGIRNTGYYQQRGGALWATRYKLTIATGGWTAPTWAYNDSGNTQEYDVQEGFSHQITCARSYGHGNTGASFGGGLYRTAYSFRDFVEIAWLWRDNLDGFDTHKRYFRRRLVETNVRPRTESTSPMSLRIDLTTNVVGAVTPNKIWIQSVRAWLDPLTDTYQSPFPMQRPTVTGVRGDGLVLSGGGDDAWLNVSPNALTKTYRWWSFDPSANPTQTALTSASSTPQDFTDQAALLDKTLFYEVTANNLVGATIKQRVYFDPVSAPIGGYALESPGAAGSIYEGYTLSWGDDFEALSVVGPGAPTGRYFPTRVYAINGGNSLPQRNGAASAVHLVDPLYTGFNDSNRGVPVGYDVMRVSSSVMTLQARRATTQESSFLPAPATQLNLCTILHAGGAIGFFPTTGKANIVEARMRILPGHANSPPAGCSAGFWTRSANPVVSGVDSDETDIFEGYKTGQTTNYHKWVGNSSTTNSPLAYTIDPDDEQWHVITCIQDKTSIEIYVDGVLDRTITADANWANKLQTLIFDMFVLTNTQGGVTFDQAEWTTSGTSQTSGQRLEIDWVRVWRPSTAAHYKPLVPIADLNVAYQGTGSLTLPSAASLWGDGAVTEYVQAIALQNNEPGVSLTTGYSPLPAGVTYDGGTRTISVDWSAVSGNAGRIHCVVQAWKADGSTCEPARFVINRGPKVVVTDIAATQGQALSYDLYPDCDVGIITPKVLAVSGLPAGLSFSPSTGLITGTPTGAGTTAISITCTNAAGQAVTVNRNIVAAAATLLAYLGNTSIVDNSNASHVFTAQPLGTANAARYIIVGLTRRNGSTAATFSSVDIAGVAASEISSYTSDSGNTRVSFWGALVPTGTSGDITVTASAALGRLNMAIWSALGVASLTPVDTLSDNSFTTQALSGVIDVPAGGVAIGMTYVGIAGETHTWAGITRHATVAGADAGGTISFASDRFVSAQTDLAVSMTYAGGAAPSQMALHVISLALT